MKRYRSSIIFAAVLVIAVAVLYWDDWQTKKDETQSKTKNKWVSFGVDDVVSINFSSKAEMDPAKPASSVTLEKNDKSWRLTFPVDALADQDAVKNFLTSVVDYQYEKSIATGAEKWGEFGLKEPRRTLEIGLKDKKEKVVLYVGDKAPVGYSLYVAINNDPNVYIGSQSLDLATAKSANDFRDKTLAQIDKEKIKNLTFSKANGTIKIAKEKGDYSITGPSVYAADQGAVIDFIDAVASQKVADFVDKPDAKMADAFSPAKRFALLSVEYADGTKAELSFTEVGADFFASYNPKQVVFKLDKSFKEKINKNLTDFRDRRLVTFNDEDIALVEIDGSRFVQVDHAWYAEKDAEKLGKKKKGKGEDKDKPEEKSHVRNLLSDVTFAKAKEFIAQQDIQAAQKNPPLHRLKFVYKEDQRKDPVIIDAWQDNKKPDLLKVKSSQVSEAMMVEKNVFAHMVEGAKEPAGESLPAEMPLEGDDLSN